ncbi:hypothetical protein N0M98_00005 [Paenibacillus doosanensis]|uniref:hypothetical protein n=1 Tax=Paenibacillus doosanensis TaxID=1229154 RepID=UPI00217FA54E|nr:hypothetical protein [Paenibacillus doosanensis]MCS7458505.1 hypothetical protein [Paenibacillus doosanensis]
MAEKNILAFFHTSEQAERIVPKLKALRVIDVSVDRIHQINGTGVSESMNPLTGSFPGLSFLTLGQEGEGIDEGILSAASVDASGMSAPMEEVFSGDFGGTDRMDTLLTVVIDEQYYDKAMRVIEEAGGKI